jgi:Histidine kinase-, DNA gyrase B-, and HSP90-like ATPase
MFKVDNADFIADKLASELLPDQEIREAAKNAEEAILRRIERDRGGEGRIEFDVDWALREIGGGWHISCADDGDGMSRAELERYTTTLAVVGANQNQSVSGNQGMGLKISGPTRHKRGVIVRSLKDGEGTMVQIGWNATSGEYGLMPLNPNGDTVLTAATALFPEFIVSRGSGTVVTFLGNEEGANTVWSGPPRPKNWLFKYLNQRFFRFSTDAVKMVALQPSGDVENWPQTRIAASKIKSFNRAEVGGTATFWDDAADRQGEGFRGVLDVAGDHANGVPAARVHWWVLPEARTGSDVSSRTAGGGSIAVLYQNELHDWRTTNHANPFFARLGVLFGKQRICFVIEPIGAAVTSDFARAHVLVNGRPVFEIDAWTLWSDQFRVAMPEKIKSTMLEEQSRLPSEDPDRIKRIQDRLKEVLALLRPRKFRPNPAGQQRATGPSTTGPGDDEGAAVDEERPTPTPRPHPPKPAPSAGALLAQLSELNGEPATEVRSHVLLHPRWVTEKEAEGSPIVNDGDRGLHDRAAGLVGENALRADVLLLNLEFRGYTAILAALNESMNADGDEGRAKLIEQATREWVEQKMIESVQGLRQLENGSSWTSSAFDDALGTAGLSAAFMADRYHTLREVRSRLNVLRPGSRNGTDTGVRLTVGSDK